MGYLTFIKQFLGRVVHVETYYDHTYYADFDDNSIIIDLGSSDGKFLEYLAKKFKCQCYGVEVRPELSNSLQNTDLIHVFNYAITDKNADIDFYVYKNTTYSIQPLSVGGQKITVRGVTLEEFLKSLKITSVDLLKVDIEGAEIEMFETTSEETLKNIKQISIEFHDFYSPWNLSEKTNKVISRLESLGFRSPGFNHMDMLFINSGKIKTGFTRNEYFKFIGLGYKIREKLLSFGRCCGK